MKNILAQLKTRYKNLGFSEKSFEGVSTYVGATIKDDATEDEIKTIIDGVEPLLKAFQGDIDSRVNTAVEKAKKEAAKKISGEPDPEPEPDDKDTPAWAKKMFDQNKALAEKIASFELGQNKKTLTEKLHSKLTEKKIPLTFAKGRSIDKEEDIETIASEIENDYLEVKQGLINDGLSGATTPLEGKGAPDKTKIHADISSWAAKHAPKTETAK